MMLGDTAITKELSESQDCLILLHCTANEADTNGLEKQLEFVLRILNALEVTPNSLKMPNAFKSWMVLWFSICTYSTMHLEK